MNRIFMEECYRKDSLKKFIELQKAKTISALDGVSNRKQRVQQYFDELEKDVNIHICWLLMWVASLSYQNENEKNFRLK